MNFETVIGAFLAALVSFLTALTALFANEPELTFSMIKTSAWVGMAGGALLQFIKDYQARSVRRAIANMRGKPNASL